MDVRAHLAGRGTSPEPSQYVKTGGLVSPELLQYLEDRYPDSFAGLDVVNMTHAEIAEHAGAAGVVRHLRALMEEAQESRTKRIIQALPQVD